MPLATRTQLLKWLLRRRRRFQVDGRSMEPSLRPGDEVLLDPRRTPMVGDVVVCAHPRRPGLRMVKRLVGTSDEGYWVEGDNPEASSDSRHFGHLPFTSIAGTVVARFHRAGERP